MILFIHLRSWIISILYRCWELKQLAQVQTLASSRVWIQMTSTKLTAEGVPGPVWVQGWPAGVWQGRRAHEEPGAGAGVLAEENWAEGRQGLWGVCWCPRADTAAISWDCPAGSEQRAMMWSLLCNPWRDKQCKLICSSCRGRAGGGGKEINELQQRESIIIDVSFRILTNHPPPPPNLE